MVFQKQKKLKFYGEENEIPSCKVDLYAIGRIENTVFQEFFLERHFHLLT